MRIPTITFGFVLGQRTSSPCSSWRIEMMKLLLFVTLSVLFSFSSTNASDHDSQGVPSPNKSSCTPVLISPPPVVILDLVDDVIDTNEDQPSTAINNDNDKDKDKGTKIKITDNTIQEGESFVISCVINKFQNEKWSQDNGEIKPEFKIVKSMMDNGLINTTLVVTNATKAHVGEYRCVSQCSEVDGTKQIPNPFVKISINSSSIVGNSDSSPKSEGPRVYHMPFPKGHRSLTVMAGDTLDMYCTIRKANYENVELVWFRNNELIEANSKDSNLVITEGNITYKQIEPIHGGVYRCQLIDKNNNNNALDDDTFVVRVKDKLGALWPFLGICGEVIVLCLIIFIYERKKNKQEMEESDTDGNNDQ